MRASERLDATAEPLFALLAVSAALVDLVSEPGELNDIPVYARASALRAHAGIVDMLIKLVGPPVVDDDFAALLAGLSAPSPRTDGPTYGYVDGKPIIGRNADGTPILGERAGW